jgi:hypothetical protein
VLLYPDFEDTLNPYSITMINSTQKLIEESTNENCKMMKNKQLAILVNDTNALLMELYNHMIVSRNIVFKRKESETNSQGEQCSQQDNCVRHKRKFAYYKEIGDIVSHYQEVVIFGPTQTKFELFKLLEADKHLNKVKIECIDTVKMSDTQMHDFVLEYYK